MRIEKETAAVPWGFHPDSIGVLATLRSGQMHHMERSLRHPLAPYNFSLARVVPRFLNALDHVEAIFRDRPDLQQPSIDWQTATLSAYELLLYGMIEHLEDCRTILSCYFATAQAMKSDRAVRDFDKANVEYRGLAAAIVNRIKHNQRRLRMIIFWNDHSVVPGYIVEGPNEAGVIGPDPVIHSRRTEAISFAKYFRFQFAHVYIISARLAQALVKVAGPPKTNQPVVLSADEPLLSIADRIGSLPLVFFPDEIALAEPHVLFETIDSNAKRLVVDYPARKSTAFTISQAKVAVAYVGDGVSGSTMCRIRRRRRNIETIRPAHNCGRYSPNDFQLRSRHHHVRESHRLPDDASCRKVDS